MTFIEGTKILVLIGISAITAITVWGDSYLKKASEHKNFFLNTDFLIGILVYSCTAFLWVYIYKYVKFSILGSVYGVLSAVIFVIIGLTIFHEKLSHTEWVGITLGVLSLVTLSKYL